ncbi:glycerate kinase [Propionispira arboris]|uniref:Glycerate kinase n=1 Tax=Propionispira arboris TaxID=84035 RepID=A0A1H6YY20_9FIRM|nr:glycerate kinase [Propionispira arboris]SEJ45276.1 glycerate kinase [Propionispira arboris]
MHIVIAPDSYKGSLTAIEAARAIQKGIKEVFPTAKITSLPIADGGEGTVKALVYSMKGELQHNHVLDPLGKTVLAEWGILDTKTAVIEMAEASGLLLVPLSKRNPLITSTYGTGQLIKAALDQGMRKIIIGLGGSATNDGGAGMAQALGVRFLDRSRKELPNGGGYLQDLASIDLTNLDKRIKDTEFILASDVKNPLCGKTGASVVYGPQKGADASMVDQLDKALLHYAAIAEKATGQIVANTNGAGAAGGLGAGLMLFCNATFRQGIQMVLELVQAERLFSEANLIFTGEGSTDFQTVYGKAPVGIGSIAKKYNVPVICVSGSLGKAYDEIFKYGITAAESIVSSPESLAYCMENAASLLQDTAKRICLILKIGATLKCEGIRVIPV